MWILKRMFLRFIYGQIITNIDRNYYCIEYKNGTKYWYLNDKLHRTDGPAIELSNGDKYWFLDGKLHRADGPAIEWNDGTESWYPDGKYYIEQEHKEITK